MATKAISEKKATTEKKTAIVKKTTTKAVAKPASKTAVKAKAAEKPVTKAAPKNEVTPGVDSTTPSVHDFVGKPGEAASSKQQVASTAVTAVKPVTAPVSRPIVMRPTMRSTMRPPVRGVIPPVQVQPQQAPSGQTELVGGRVVWRSSAPTYNNGSNGNGYAQSGNFAGEVDGRIIPDAGMPTEDFRGILDVNRDGNGVLRSDYSGSKKDAYISSTQIRRFNLRGGDVVEGPARAPKENEQYWGLLKVEKVNGKDPDKLTKRVNFMDLTPVFPDKKLVLETGAEPQSTRLIDLVAPIGLGQRGLIVSPPKAGKTTILKDMATGIAANYKDVMLMAVLIGERPEEVTDIKRHIAAITNDRGEVAASNFDEAADEQTRIAELALERAKRLVELGENVVILLDSITRLARAYNLAIPTSGRTLSGGFDPAALYPPKRFFGAARNFEPFETPDGKKSGSLTILGTALVDTGSKMDDLVYEEFKGTGNMELHLDRKLAERRIYPAIDVQRSGTRREDLLFSSSEYQAVLLMRRMYDLLDPKERTQALLGRMKQTKTNKEFLASLKEG